MVSWSSAGWASLCLALTLGCSSSPSPDETDTSEDEPTGSAGSNGSVAVNQGASGATMGEMSGVAPQDAGAVPREAGPLESGTLPVIVAKPQAGDVVVNLGELHQTMDGFGASDNYNPAFTDQQADMIFSATSGIGLSLLRVSISPKGSDLAPVSNAQKAFARGAKIWIAPWTPPGEWKDNGTDNNGGHLKAVHYDDWANVLAGVVTTMAMSNVTVYGVSIQNEPDYTASYASCLYTYDEMAAFVNALAPKLAALPQKPKLMLPDTSGWAQVWSYWNAATANGKAAESIDILATHQYFIDDPPAHPIPAGKVLWQTEDSSFDGFNGDIGNAINVSKWIHNAIVHGGVSAWHYWAIWGRNKDNEGLLSESGATTKRFFAMGNFSKFVRPGFVRVGTTASPNGTMVTAYKEPTSGALAIVVINTSSAKVPFSVALNGSSATSVIPWVTSAELDLAAQTKIPVSEGRLMATLPGSSVTTFVSPM